MEIVLGLVVMLQTVGR